MITLYPYIRFEGNCEEALHFYATIFGGCILFKRYGDDTGSTVPELYYDRIMHGRLTGGRFTLAAADRIVGVDPPVAVNESVELVIDAEDTAECRRIFRALAIEGKVLIDLQRTAWTEQHGLVIDRYGIFWQINAPLKTF